MAKHWQQRRKRDWARKLAAQKHQQRPQEFILLDQFSAADIKKWKELQNRILTLHWDYYCSLAYQRSKVQNDLQQALLYAAERDFKFEKWQRAVTYKYALKPLSLAGSLVDPGGRFNIGEIDTQRFPPFPALYIACDKDTALQELLCQKKDPGNEAHALEFALLSPASIASVSISGTLDSVINLNAPDQLVPFVEIFKNFSLPEHIQEESKEIGLGEQFIIKTVSQLISGLLDPYWRAWPMNFDVPVASQIFGQMVLDAGIDGILYPSKFSGKDCLAIFPQNFDYPEKSFVQLDDETPPDVKIKRLDVSSWELERNELGGQVG